MEWRLQVTFVHVLTEAGELGDAGTLEFEDNAEGVTEVAEEGFGTWIISDDALGEMAFVLYLIYILAQNIAFVIVR